MPKLHIVTATGSRSEFDVTSDDITIGRAPDNSLQITDQSVSPHHALLRRSGTTHQLWDLSANQTTFINNTHQAQAVLHDGDRIQLGAVEIRFALNAPVAMPATSPAPAAPVYGPDEILGASPVESSPRRTIVGRHAPPLPPGAGDIAEEWAAKKYTMLRRSNRYHRKLAYRIVSGTGVLIFLAGYLIEINFFKFAGLLMVVGGTLSWVLDPFSRGKRKARVHEPGVNTPTLESTIGTDFEWPQPHGPSAKGPQG